jgi:hypothetical protein
VGKGKRRKRRGDIKLIIKNCRKVGREERRGKLRGNSYALLCYARCNIELIGWLCHPTKRYNRGLRHMQAMRPVEKDLQQGRRQIRHKLVAAAPGLHTYSYIICANIMQAT